MKGGCALVSFSEPAAKRTKFVFIVRYIYYGAAFYQNGPMFITAVASLQSYSSRQLYVLLFSLFRNHNFIIEDLGLNVNPFLLLRLHYKIAQDHPLFYQT